MYVNCILYIVLLPSDVRKGRQTEIVQASASTEPVSRLQRLLDVAEIPDFTSIADGNIDVIHYSTTALSLSGLRALTSAESSGSIQTLLSAHRHWNLLSEGVLYALASERNALLLRAHHMLGHWAWWTFIILTVPRSVTYYLEHGFSSAEANHELAWLLNIISHIHHSVLAGSTQVQQHSICFSDVFPNDASTSVFHDASVRPQRVYSSEDNVYDDLVCLTRQTLAQWLGLQQIGPDASRRRLEDWDIRGRFIDAILHLRQPGILVLPVAYSIFLSPSIAFPRLDTDAQAVYMALESKFVRDEENLPRIRTLSTLVVESCPDMTFESINRWHHSIEATLLQAPDLVDSFPTSEMDVDIDPDIQVAGDAIVQFLLDIKDLGTAAAPSTSGAGTASGVQSSSQVRVLI